MKHMADAPDGDNISVDQPSEFNEQNQQKNLKMAASIVLQNDPITHDYADVEPIKPKNLKTKNFKRTFID